VRLEGVVSNKTLSDIGRLLLDGDKNVTGLVVETLLAGVVTDLLDTLSDNLMEAHHDQNFTQGFYSRLNEPLTFW
jgi:hypothetical protein